MVAVSNAAFRIIIPIRLLLRATDQFHGITRLVRQQVVTRFDQPIELFALLRDTVGVAFLGLATRLTCGLFDQLPEIVPKYRDAIIELGSRKRIVVTH
jgi:hypothetical protein